MSKLSLGAALLLGLPVFLAAAPIEKILNPKVRVVEQTLAPGEALPLPSDKPGVVVYFDDGSVETTRGDGAPRMEAVKRGEAVFESAGPGALKNSGSSDLRVVWTQYLGAGTSETWGRTGLAPHYTLLFENQYGRVYDIRIPAQSYEPLHTHHDRVVVCLSGAQLEHIMLDGRKEVSSLKTDEVVWRLAATHVGHNLGLTDLWVIAIEPK
jgi:hypothetical protein